MILFDSHCHLTDEAFDEDRESLLSQMKDEGIFALCTATDMESCKASLALADTYPNVYAACGLHPEDIAAYDGAFLDSLRAFLSHPRCIALGEIGLDYHWDTSQTGLQKQAFAEQIALANEANKTVVVHSRDAAGDTYEILKSSLAPGQKAVLHAFSQSREMLENYLRLPGEIYFSLGGTVTFKNASRLRETAVHIPLERLLIETDSPYLTPHPYRGKRNSPLYLKETALALAGLYAVSFEELAAVTARNAQAVFAFAIGV